MSYESNSGLGVSNHYGPRGKEDGVASGGEVHKSGAEFEHVVYISGDDFDGGTSFNTRLTIPAGSVFIAATMDVEEVFTLGNADNIFSIGTDTSEATNGVAIANPDVAGVTKDVTGGGTWSPTAGLAADTAVGVAVSGTTAAVTAGSGKAKVVLRFAKI
jgi:hypothetical protein